MLLLVRHGPTSNDPERRWWGRAEVPLADLAPLELARTAAFLAGYHPTRLLTSPVGRAVASASIMAPVLDLPVEVVPALTEMDLGHFSGLTPGECSTLFAKEWRAYLADTVDTAPPGGESYRQLADRVREWALAQSPEQQVVAVTHTGVILALVCWAMGLPLLDRVRLGEAPPASLTALRAQPPRLYRFAQLAPPAGPSGPSTSE